MVGFSNFAVDALTKFHLLFAIQWIPLDLSKNRLENQNTTSKNVSKKLAWFLKLFEFLVRSSYKFKF